ncbi:MAG: chromate efflux transporter [Burkholderiaceae bacterium]|nr:chromate efflux transporter [Burkholderiaceae bacterium]
MSEQTTPSISFSAAFVFWLKLGFISFGGPAGQIALMHQELVVNKRWISERRFLHALNYCMVLPGPEAQQLATYMGWLMHKTIGGITAGVLFVLPSLFILIGLSWLYIAYGQLPLVAGLFYGIKAAVLAIVLHAAVRIGKRSLQNKLHWGVAVLAFFAMLVAQISFPLIVVVAALIGVAAARWWPQFITPNAAHKTGNAQLGAAIIDDHTPTPAHALFSWWRLSQVVLFGAVMWCVPMLALWQRLGWQHNYTQMAWFFTKAALLTFGGAYAVLPYVYQGAVSEFRWLTPSQMIDGLALGESTPGPLIMIVAFVGFIGAYVLRLCGPDQQFLAGVLGACLVTWFTFLPSFIFILAGGPFIESTHKQISFTAPLAMISAAVVGVIASLALFFAYHVLWPAGFAARIDIGAAVLACAAAWALFRRAWSVIPLLIISALLGMAMRFLF